MVVVRRGRLAVAAVCLALLSMVAFVSAEAQTPWEQPDQIVDPTLDAIAILDDRALSQVFTAGRSGELGRVDLHLNSRYGDVIIQVRTTTGGVPDGGLTATPEQILTSTTLSVDSAGIDIVRFSQPINVVEGTQYAIVVLATPDSWWSWSVTTIEYAGGLGRSCTDTTCWERAPGHFGYGFITYVREPDSVQPTGTLSINAGATYTKSTDVTLNLTCQDTISGCDQVRFSTEGPDAAMNATPVSYEESIALTLPSGDGTKNVYLQFLDTAGNASEVVSGSIELDTTPPETTILSGPPAITNATTAMFTLPDGDDTYTCTLDSGTPADCTSPYTLRDLSEGAHTVAITATDLAGNTDLTPATYSWTIDLTNPTIQPIQSVTLDPEGPGGAIVDFSTRVNDDLTLPGSLVTECVDGSGDPVISGYLMPIGTTVVTCTVTDQAGNQASTSFTITVRSVGSLWADLGVALVELGLPTSTERTLMTQMAVAQALANAGQPGMACQQLGVLDMSVKSQESKRRIDRRDAAAIYAQTQQLRNVIGCGGARG